MMNEEKLQAREMIQSLSTTFREQGDPTGWFDTLYASAKGNEQVIPWANMLPNPLFTDWAKNSGLQGTGKWALQVGCGLGDDAEELVRLGFNVVAFDVSPHAISWCHKRFPDSQVDYQVADLFAPPAFWSGKFDFMLEAYTLQALPPEVRGRAIENLASCLSPTGRLLVICRGCDSATEQVSIPWPLTRDELAGFLNCGLHEIAFEDFVDDEANRRFRVQYAAR